MEPVNLDVIVDNGNMHILFENSPTFNYEIERDRIVLKGFRNPDGSINEGAASRLLDTILDLYGTPKPRLTLVKKIIYNSKGEPSGELLLNSKTGRVVGGYGWVDWKTYNIVPLNHPPDTEPSWKLDPNGRALTVMNNFSPEYAELAVAEAQVKYGSSRQLNPAA